MLAHATITTETATSPCPCCRDPMRLVRTIPKLGGLPALHVYLCERCRHVETIEQERAA
jgi:hypothetical protein